MTSRRQPGRGLNHRPRPSCACGLPMSPRPRCSVQLRGWPPHRERPRQLLARRDRPGDRGPAPLNALGVAWLGVPAGPWRSSQWLSEVVMYGAVDHLGWAALVALRLLTAAALFAVLALTLVRRRQPLASFLVLFGVVVGIEALLQDRPATVSLVFVALLGASCERLWVTGRAPSRSLSASHVCCGPSCTACGCSRPRRSSLSLSGHCSTAAGPRPPVSLSRCPGVRRAVPGRSRQSTGGRFLPVAGPIPAGGGNADRRVRPTTFTVTLSIAWGFLVLFLIFAWVRSQVQRAPTEVRGPCCGRFSG